MMNVQLHQLLRFLVDENGHVEVIKAVHFAIDQRKAEAGFDGPRRKYLHHLNLRTPFEKAIHKERVHNTKKLAQVLQALHLGGNDLFGFQERVVPWDEWEAGRKIVVVMGGKLARLPESELRSQVVGGQDARALRVLERVLRDHAGIQYVAETITLSPTMSASEAQADFDKLLKMKDVDAIIVLGSEIVNPLAAPVARRIFGGMNPRDVPVHFRWSYPIHVDNPFLASRKVCPPENEGIALSYDEEQTSLPRVGDQLVVEAVRKGKRGPFLDCGILAMSAQDEKILVLCAGHGGCGTTAAVHALSRVDYVQRRILESAQAGPEERYIPPGTILEPIWVKRRKKTLELIDDFTFDDNYGAGWQFYFDDEAEGSMKSAG